MPFLRYKCLNDCKIIGTDTVHFGTLKLRISYNPRVLFTFCSNDKNIQSSLN